MSNDKKQLVFVGLSGGVDSAVAAGLLKKEGYSVVGVFMKCWDNKEDLIGCGWEKDEEDARQVAAKLEIPFYSWDFTQEYRDKVIKYFLDGYKKGITPNPDIECNREIKFGLFLNRALRMGADYIATGHYVRLKRINDKYHLLKGLDSNKDQSYFLWTLTQSQFKHCLFPIGKFKKNKVRDLAKDWDLPVKDKPDSQGICFMGKVNVEDFLKKHISSSPGKIKTTEGDVIGEHEGLEIYTIGQRRGIRIGGGIPYFVIGKDFGKNELIVAKGRKNKALFEKELLASNFNWILGKKPKIPLRCKAKIRYRQEDQSCHIFEEKKNNLRVVFDKNQRAVTPGQSIVFYKKDRMIGGGIIN